MMQDLVGIARQGAEMREAQEKLKMLRCAWRRPASTETAQYNNGGTRPSISTC